MCQKRNSEPCSGEVTPMPGRHCSLHHSRTTNIIGGQARRPDRTQLMLGPPGRRSAAPAAPAAPAALVAPRPARGAPAAAYAPAALQVRPGMRHDSLLRFICAAACMCSRSADAVRCSKPAGCAPSTAHQARRGCMQLADHCKASLSVPSTGTSRHSICQARRNLGSPGAHRRGARAPARRTRSRARAA